MNELDSILAFIPEKYRGATLLAVMLSPYVTRAAYALMNNGGLRGVVRAIWLGTNTPKPNPPPDQPQSQSQPQPPAPSQP